MKPIQLALIAITLVSTQVFAEMPYIVGTWQKKDKSLVEFKEDGSVIVTSTGNPVAKWKPWPQPGTPQTSWMR